MMLGFGMGFGAIGIVIMLAFWIGLIAFSIWIVKTLFQDSSDNYNTRPGSFSNPKEILDQRYSRGEITREQYELMKQDIS